MKEALKNVAELVAPDDDEGEWSDLVTGRE